MATGALRALAAAGASWLSSLHHAELRAAVLMKIRTQVILSAAGGYFVLCIIKVVKHIDSFAGHTERPFLRPITESP